MSDDSPDRSRPPRHVKTVLVLLVVAGFALSGTTATLLYLKPWQKPTPVSPPLVVPPAVLAEAKDEGKLDLRGRANLLAGARVLLAAGESERFDERVSLDRGYQELRVRMEFAAPPAAAEGAQFLLRSTRYFSGWKLNGRPIPQPLAEMKYNFAGPVRAGDLQNGTNVLEADFTMYLMESRSGPAGEVADLQVALLEVQPEDLAVRMGPILGYAGEDFFTVTCRTDVPAEVTLKVGEKSWTSPAGYHHLLKATGLEPDTPCEYALEVRLDLLGGPKEIVCGPYRTRTLPRTGKLVFAALGDNREGVKVWHAISEHVRTSGAHFVVHTGDMVYQGRSEKFWQAHFYQPARDFCSSVPGYYVPGNHEDDTPAFTRLLATPSGQKNWHQRIGPVLLIGLDSDQGDWTPGATDYAWLEGVLAGGADAKFIFLACHYPAYSASKGGWDCVRPVFELLEKHRATAMIAGDAHGYERSEPGRGTTMIVSAGAGAPLYWAIEPKMINPHSAVFCSEYNYCLFSVEGDTCTMRAYGFGDQDELAEPRVIDTRTWKAR